MISEMDPAITPGIHIVLVTITFALPQRPYIFSPNSPRMQFILKMLLSYSDPGWGLRLGCNTALP